MKKIKWKRERNKPLLKNVRGYSVYIGCLSGSEVRVHIRSTKEGFIIAYSKKENTVGMDRFFETLPEAKKAVYKNFKIYEKGLNKGG